MARFKVGDRARIVSPHSTWSELIGKECTIVAVYIGAPRYDYQIDIDGINDGRKYHIADWSLEPIIDAELGSWEALAELGWDPRNVKEQA